MKSRLAFLLSLAGTALLLCSLGLPWLQIPLLHGWAAWELPISLGWGLQSRAISYGLVGLLLTTLVLARILSDASWPFRFRSSRRPRLLTPQALLRIGVTTATLPLLFLFQFVLADFQLVSTVQDQENQAVLLRRHVSHTLPRQHLAVRSFHIDTADPGDRWRLLIMTGGPGLLLPVGAAVTFLYGAFLMRGRERKDERRPLTSSSSGRRRLIRRLVIGTGAAAVIIVLARAPSALIFLQLARSSLQAGDVHGAISLTDTALAVNPSLENLPALHLTAGEALYRIRAPQGEDVGLFRAAHDQAIGLFSLAWQEDVAMMQSAPDDPVVRHDTERTLEMLAEANSPVKLTPADQDTARKNALTPLQIKIVDKALPWLDRLIYLQQDNVYAHYLRGRILFTAHAYDAASRDFQAALSLTTDGNMRSESYTYLAFCRGGLQDYAGQRALLQIAVRLDKGYYNSVAHQALSGLH